MTWIDNPEPRKKPPLDTGVVVLTGLVLLIAYVSYDQGRIGRVELLFYAALLPSIILHEVSHGFVAKMFGDMTARDAGRLTLNPLRHIDRFGTIILPAILLLTIGTAFGYAKPVPVNPSGMTRNQSLYTSLAGPATNIVIALVAALMIRIFGVGGSGASLALEVFIALGFANVVLAVFNLIPLPPLDGSALLERFLPTKYMAKYLVFRRYSMFVLIGIMLLIPGVLTSLFDPAIALWVGLNPSLTS